MYKNQYFKIFNLLENNDKLISKYSLKIRNLKFEMYIEMKKWTQNIKSNNTFYDMNTMNDIYYLLELNFFRKNRLNKTFAKHKHIQQRDMKNSHCIFSSMYHELVFIASFDVLIGIRPSEFETK